MRITGRLFGILAIMAIASIAMMATLFVATVEPRPSIEVIAPEPAKIVGQVEYVGGGIIILASQDKKNLRLFTIHTKDTPPVGAIVEVTYISPLLRFTHNRDGTVTQTTRLNYMMAAYKLLN